MKRLCIYILAFLTLWLSTWMVTDIHDLSISDTDPAHAIFSAQHSHSDSEVQSHDHSHCGVCSYDHGGHIGQMLATRSYIVISITAQNTINNPLQSELIYSRKVPPQLRPPIA